MNKQTWLVAALIVSLGLNMLFIGVVIGRTMSGGGPPPHMQWMMQELDEDTRKTIRQAMRKTAKESGETRRALRSAQRQLHEHIGAEDYDKEAVIKALAEVRRASNEMQEIMHRQMVDSLEMMAPEERLRVYRMLSGARHGRRGPDRPPRNREG